MPESASASVVNADTGSLSASVPKIYLTRLRVRYHGTSSSLDDHAAVMEHGNPFGQIECGVHVVLDHHHGHVARNPGDQRFHRDAFLEREPGKRVIGPKQ